ncbi:MAG: hypothetical protein RLZZ381_2104 [Cyanobacteriota bacterium]|jgi:hypothetical protein
MPNSSPESMSFSQAIAVTQSLMDQMNSNKLSDFEVQQKVLSILSSKNGGRGFFVAYLTSDMPLADSPSTGVLNGLKSAAEMSSELLVKNLAMSSAMIVAHSQNNDSENVAGSQRVCQRTCNLIQQLNLQLIEKKLQEIQNTIKNGSGKYQKFIERWGYSTEQKKAIQDTIANLI